jgi:hypothetical protein
VNVSFVEYQNNAIAAASTEKTIKFVFIINQRLENSKFVLMQCSRR